MNIEDSFFVETESSLIRKHKQLLLENRYEFIMIDLGRDIPIFKWFISNKSTWESHTVINKTEWLLNQIAAAHKQFSKDTVKDMLTDAAKRMRNISKGGMISNQGYEYMIDNAVELKGVTDVEPNASIRYLKNPYFIWEKGDFENRKEIYRTHLNGVINKGISEVNYELIRTILIDYDLNQKKINKTILKNASNLSLSTIKNYLNNYPELNEIYRSIKDNSGTVKQRKQKEYNANKMKVA
ncbi:hypothetical protein [Polaribacter sp.]|uniref:hypothetical protein n=1 Tax=Polaribacter sp. TaxID=1920175 RepID=UPI0025D09FCF|nr:hypothetical protein [Polaribacter sp.]